MKLINIYNKGRIIYLFKRDDEGRQFIQKVTDFYPYFYESCADENGTTRSVTGAPVKKMIVSDPKDIRKMRTDRAWDADIFHCQRYMRDKVDSLEKCPIKWAMLDIEVLCPELPDATIAKYPISCITIYNNFTKAYNTYYLKDYPNEFSMMEAFIAYVKKERFDLLTAWNMTKFDMLYMCNRFPDFAEKISPINETRYGGEVAYPAGISIVDYYTWFKSVTLNREKSYKLDDIAQKYLGDEPKKEIGFGELTEDLKAKNKLDVEQMVRLEEQKQLIPYFDEIRRLSKVEWEDMVWTSRIIDMLILQEAKNRDVVLPMKPNEERGTLAEKEDYLGAYREAIKTGLFKGIGVYDLTSAYPFAIKDFCLDPINIKLQKEKNCIEINNTYFHQKEDAILPTVVSKLMTLKNNIKKKLSTMQESNPDYKNVEQMYNAIKSIVNSSYGVFGNRFFRMYDNKVASATTFIVRSLLHYVKDKIEELGHEVIYVDTDGVFIKGTEDLTDTMNSLVQQWGKEVFGKEKVSIEFEYQGNFKKLLLLTLCRYVGELQKPNGDTKEEMKGIEAKRKDSTVFMKDFQKELIKKIMNEVDKDEIFSWIKSQIVAIHDAPLEDVSFPVKLSRPIEDYKNVPIFVRAMQNTKNFTKKLGENFYFIYVIPTEYETKTQVIELLDGVKLTPSKLKDSWKLYYGENILVKHMAPDKKEELINHLEKEGRVTKKTIEVRGKAKDVMAFDPGNKEHIESVDWTRMIQRNILMKLEVIFAAMDWSMEVIK